MSTVLIRQCLCESSLGGQVILLDVLCPGSWMITFDEKLSHWIHSYNKGFPNMSLMYEPGHEKTCLVSYANNKCADQPAHPRSLISAFVVRCLDSVMSLVSVTKIICLMLASVAEQASLSLTWSKTPEDMFSRDEARML